MTSEVTRRSLVAGNWKMHTTIGEALELATALRQGVSPSEQVEVAICPPFTALADVGRAVRGSALQLGAQDVFWETEGAFTGEISPRMLVDVGCRYVIVGHSERRRHFGETDEIVARKVRTAFAHQLIPIACVGEHLHERDAGETDRVVSRQVSAIIAELRAEEVRQLVIAYEPIWAIGTGRAARGEDANRVIGGIRGVVLGPFPAEASQVRILYGGSVTPQSIGEFSQQPEIDGALVGGASLDHAKFLAIVREVAKSRA